MEPTNKRETFAEIINGDTPVLVDFFAEWCGPCKMMAPELKKLADQQGENLRVLKVDVDKNQNAAAAYQIRGVPTFIIFKKGKQIWRQSGVVPEAMLIQQLKLASQ